MTHNICRECECQALCMKSGCRGYLDKLEALINKRAPYMDGLQRLKDKQDEAIGVAYSSFGQGASEGEK